jgi:hypothetical protein
MTPKNLGNLVFNHSRWSQFNDSSTMREEIFTTKFKYILGKPNYNSKTKGKKEYKTY